MPTWQMSVYTHCLPPTQTNSMQIKKVIRVLPKTVGIDLRTSCGSTPNLHSFLSSLLVMLSHILQMCKMSRQSARLVMQQCLTRMKKHSTFSKIAYRINVSKFCSPSFRFTHLYFFLHFTLYSSNLYQIELT